MRALVLLSLFAACVPMTPRTDAVAGDPVADFSLNDENPASATANQQVSPRQRLGRVSGWYFTHSS